MANKRMQEQARKPLPKNLSAKQMQTIQTVNKSAAAGHKMIRENPPKVSVRTWLKSKVGLGPPKAERERQKKIKEALPGARATARKAKRVTRRVSTGRASGR